MRVMLLKRWQNSLKSWPRGTILTVDKETAGDLIQNGTAVDYDGKYPPEQKIKMNFNQK